MATRSPKQASMCCVTIGFQDFLLPTDKGLRVVELMKDAVSCEKRFFDSQLYFARSQMLELGMTIVSSKQIHKEANKEAANTATTVLQQND